MCRASVDMTLDISSNQASLYSLWLQSAIVKASRRPSVLVEYTNIIPHSSYYPIISPSMLHAFYSRFTYDFWTDPQHCCFDITRWTCKSLDKHWHCAHQGGHVLASLCIHNACEGTCCVNLRPKILVIKWLRKSHCKKWDYWCAKGWLPCLAKSWGVQKQAERLTCQKLELGVEPESDK